MSLLADLMTAVGSGAVEVVDLTAPLSSSTPILQLPEPLGNTDRFQLREISRYDDRGPAWYWNNITTGEHTGTHFDAPNHWVTGQDGIDISAVPPVQLVAPAVVIDHSAESAADPDFLLEISHVQAWEQEHGPLPEGGWLLYRTGWDARADSQQDALNVTETGPHSPGVSVECAQWLAESTPILGLGTETVGTDAGKAGGFDPPYPAHNLLHKNNRYGLASLANLDKLPPKGAILIAAPLKFVAGTGSPIRALALVPRG